MRGATVAVVLLGLLAVVSAGDVSEPKHLTGRLSCLLPIERVRCTRDWRSGFVAGISYAYDLPKAEGIFYTQVCSNQINNQTRYQMWQESSVISAQNAAPAWYNSTTEKSDYVMAAGSLITQVIVLHASNPWGDKFGTIPAVIFVYINPADTTDVKYATCGNALYSNAYLRPDTAPAPPTPVSLKASYSSGLSEDGTTLTVLGGFDGKCATRGTQFVAYHGGDPWKSSKFYMKALTKPCFVDFQLVNQEWTPTPPASAPPSTSPKCDKSSDPANLCNVRPCFFDKKNKKGPSYSCAATGPVIATGKYGIIHFDEHGDEYEYAPDAQGKLQRVKGESGKTALDGIVMEEPEEP